MAPQVILERYANGTSTDPWWQQVENLADSAREDKELRDWFKSMDSYIRRCLLEEGYVLEEASNTEWDRLYKHGRYLLRDKYRQTTDKILDETRFILDQFDQDPQNKEFGLAVQKLFNHLGQDAEGKPAFKPHLVKDLTNVILPAFVENVQYIPVPRIEYQDPQFDIVIENLIFEADNLFPNIVEVTSNNYFKMGRKKLGNSANQVFDVKLAGVQMDLRNVSYHIKRKKGFPAITDTGIVNILLSGNGLSFECGVATAKKTDKEHLFKVSKVDVDIKNLKIKLVKSKFKMPWNLVGPVLTKVMNPVITKAVEKVLKKQFQNWDQAAWEIRQDAKQSLDRPLEEGAKKPNLYTRYATSAKRYAEKKKEEQKKKVAEKTSESKVNIAYTMHESIFPDIKLPGATSEKATKYKDLAMQGDKWQSPVFSIGHASKSNDVPRAPRIQEKLDEKQSWGEARKRKVAEKKNVSAEKGGVASNMDGDMQNAGARVVGNDGGLKGVSNGGQYAMAT